MTTRKKKPTKVDKARIYLEVSYGAVPVADPKFPPNVMAIPNPPHPDRYVLITKAGTIQPYDPNYQGDQE